MSILQSRTRIRFQDCDPFGHLNNARFIDYFLNARADQVLEQFGIDIFGSSGFTWLVGSNQIAYFRQALLNEEILIESQVIDFAEKRIVVEMRMYDAEQTHLKALLWVDSIPFSIRSQKVEPHGPELMEMFRKNHLPVQQERFEERRAYMLSTRPKSA